MRPLFPPTLCLFLLASIGCAQTRVYRVTVRNKTDEPITVGLTKDGPPFERGWLSPEELTDVPPSRRPTQWGAVVAPGMKGSVRVEGKFESGTHAMLRIYRGQAPIDELLAMSHGLGSRTDVALTPTEINDFTVEDQAGHITAHLTRPPSGLPSPPPPAP